VAVPWSSVGAGWVLTEYSTGTSASRGATTLELTSPAGAKYPLYTWAKSVTPPTLAAWSPSKTEVMLMVWGKNLQPSGVYDRLNLQTGKISTLSLGQATRVVSYTRPTGLQILAEQVKSTTTMWSETLERITKTGQPVKVLATSKYTQSNYVGFGAVYAPDGASVALDFPGGLAIVSNAGGAVKKLPVPGADKEFGCVTSRWWNSSTILANCGNRLWLVPSNGANPTALTPQRGTAGTGGDVDLGDFAAWHLPSGLYLNSFDGPACGDMVIRASSACFRSPTWQTRCTSLKASAPPAQPPGRFPANESNR
jgi:hypothetical protein